MKTKYKSENKIRKEVSIRVPKEVIEKRFIMNFFDNLPIEKLKESVNYKEINPDDKELQKNPLLQKLLHELYSEGVIKITAEIEL